MPRYEFSWHNDDESYGWFNTCCPDMGEAMMRSQTDFPQVSLTMKARFKELFGGVRGSFAELLRRESGTCSIEGIATGIEGLMIRVRNVFGSDLR